jgi:putative sigma-54 modulation protein
MRSDFHGRNTEITGRFRDHAEPRLAGLQRHFDQIQSVKVVVAAQRNWRMVEITVDADGLLTRAQERSDDDLTAFDRALEAIERQLDRFRQRVRDARRRPHEHPEPPAPEPEAQEEPAEVEILRTKTVSLKPMTAQEAAMQMDLLGHDFFLYTDDETDRVAVVYRRREGGYGVLIAE